jgi:hypothetical protein
MTGNETAVNGTGPDHVAFTAGGMASAAVLGVSRLHRGRSADAQVKTGTGFEAVMIPFLRIMKAGFKVVRLFAVAGNAIDFGIFSGIGDQVHVGICFIISIRIAFMAGDTSQLSVWAAEKGFSYKNALPCL